MNFLHNRKKLLLLMLLVPTSSSHLHAMLGRRACTLGSQTCRATARTRASSSKALVPYAATPKRSIVEKTKEIGKETGKAVAGAAALVGTSAGVGLYAKHKWDERANTVKLEKDLNEARENEREAIKIRRALEKKHEERVQKAQEPSTLSKWWTAFKKWWNKPAQPPAQAKG